MKRAEFRAGNLAVTSYGGGTAYAVRNRKTGGTVFLQGEDAEQFERDVLATSNPDLAYSLHGYVELEEMED